jgi:hypothetical protein
MSFVKSTMRVVVSELNDAEYYQEEAEKIAVDEDDEEADETLKQMKIALLDRAKELEEEELPSVGEVFKFLCEVDNNEPRYISMIKDTICWNKIYSPKIYIEGEDVMISFVADFVDCSKYFEQSEIEELEELWNEEPFYKSRVGGSVGNYCKMPSRKNLDDQLCEFVVDVRLVFVTDETGEQVFDPFEDEDSDVEDLEKLSDIEEEEDVSSEEEGEVKHPFFVTHESLFGPSDGLDLDSVPYVKKPSWSKRFVPKPIRAIFKRVD